MNLFQLVVLVLVVLADIGLGLSVLLRNPKGHSNRSFALTALAMVIWLITNFMCDQPMFYGRALLLNRLAVATGFLLAIPLFAVAGGFSRDSAKFAPEWWVLFASIGALAALSVFTDWIVAAVEVRSWAM